MTSPPSPPRRLQVDRSVLAEERIAAHYGGERARAWAAFLNDASAGAGDEGGGAGLWGGAAAAVRRSLGAGAVEARLVCGGGGVGGSDGEEGGSSSVFSVTLAPTNSFYANPTTWQKHPGEGTPLKPHGAGFAFRGRAMAKVVLLAKGRVTSTTSSVEALDGAETSSSALVAANGPADGDDNPHEALTHAMEQTVFVPVFELPSGEFVHDLAILVEHASPTLAVAAAVQQAVRQAEADAAATAQMMGAAEQGAAAATLASGAVSSVASGGRRGGGSNKDAPKDPPLPPSRVCFELAPVLGGHRKGRSWVYPHRRIIEVVPLFREVATTQEAAASGAPGAVAGVLRDRAALEAARRSGEGVAVGTGELLYLLCASLGLPHTLTATAEEPAGAAAVDCGGGTEEEAGEREEKGEAKNEALDEAKGGTKGDGGDGGDGKDDAAASPKVGAEMGAPRVVLRVGLSRQAVAALADQDLPSLLLGDLSATLGRLSLRDQARLAAMASAHTTASLGGGSFAGGAEESGGVAAVRLYLTALGGLVNALRCVRNKALERRALLTGGSLDLHGAVQTVNNAIASGRLPMPPPPALPPPPKKTSLANASANADDDGNASDGGAGGGSAPVKAAAAPAVVLVPPSVAGTSPHAFSIAAWRSAVPAEAWGRLSAAEQAAAVVIKATHPDLTQQWLVRLHNPW